ncbi:MAG: E3 ubiquitin protein ligase [Candidatus Heimdallarchaeota archaeon]|nr:E3 ubiquitin protein ligase [Candidatus Heimdallarchaeota archaeon]
MVCEICKSVIFDHEPLAVCHNCNQDFHEQHINTWLKKDSKCPICKEEFTRSKKRKPIAKLVDLGIRENPLDVPKPVLPEDVDFSKGKSWTILTKINQPMKIEIQKDIMKITNYHIPLKIRILKNQINSLNLSVIMVIVIRIIFSTPNSDKLPYILFMLFVSLLVIKRHSFLNKYQSNIYDGRLYIGRDLKTNLGSNVDKTLQYNLVTDIHYYELRTNKKGYFLGLELENNNLLFIGNEKSGLDKENLDKLNQILISFLGFNKKYKKTGIPLSTFKKLKSVGISTDTRMYHFSFSGEEILKRLTVPILYIVPISFIAIELPKIITNQILAESINMILIYFVIIKIIPNYFELFS